MGGMSQDFKSIGKNDTDLWYLFNSWQGIVEENLNRNFLYFDAIGYKQQVVAGMTYEVKYAVGMNEFVVVQIYQPLPGSSNNNPEFKLLVRNTVERDNLYGSSAMLVKTCMIASAVSSAFLFA